MPLAFKELPRLHSAETDIYGSHRDLESALASQPSMKPTSHLGARGPDRVRRADGQRGARPGGLHGIHHLTVTAENAAAAEATAWPGSPPRWPNPGICAAYSESVEMDEEIRRSAREKADNTGANTARKIYLSYSNPQAIEDGHARRAGDAEADRRRCRLLRHQIPHR